MERAVIQLLREQGRSIADTARVLGMERQQLYFSLHRTSAPRAPLALRLARLLAVPEDALIDGDGYWRSIPEGS